MQALHGDPQHVVDVDLADVRQHGFMAFKDFL